MEVMEEILKDFKKGEAKDGSFCWYSSLKLFLSSQSAADSPRGIDPLAPSLSYDNSLVGFSLQTSIMF
jgi:hypothetical protein